MTKLSEIIEKIKPSVVAVGFTFSPEGIIKPEDISGSGFMISERGYVCTCAHVVRGEQGQLRVSVWGGDGYPHASGEIVLLDYERDIAIIKIPPPPQDIKVNLLPLELGDSLYMKEGQDIAFCGFPFGGGTGGGFTASTTKGIISAVRPKQVGKEIVNHFQLDAMTMEGNRG